MRVYGTIENEEGQRIWQVVTTDANGFNDNVYLTALCQDLLLQLGESPFYANFGIPATQSVQTQVPPDYWVMQTQQEYAQYFASLIISKVSRAANPTYKVVVITHQGAILTQEVAI